MNLPRAGVDTIPTFNVKKVPAVQRTVLVLDISGGFIEELNEVDVEGVEPMVSVTPMRLKRRVDAVTDGNYADKVQKNAPDAREGFFAVPKVVE